MGRALRIQDIDRKRVAGLQLEIVNGDGSFSAPVLATDAEAVAKSSAAALLTPANLPAVLAATAASTTAAGLVELATDAEAQAETLGARALTPANLRQGAPALDAGTLQAMFAQRYTLAPAAVSAVAVLPATNLGAAAQEITAGLTAPDFPRTVTVKGNVAGIVGNVVVTGTNIAGTTIEDTIALNGVAEVEGVEAFASVDQVDLPEQTHAPAYQIETATAAGTITSSGDAQVIVTAAGMTGSPKTLAVAVLENDTAAQWAEKIRTALTADAAVAALFTVGGADVSITLTRKVYAVDDGTLNIALADGTCVGITAAPASANTQAGVPVDTVSMGIAKKFGLPHVVSNAAMLLVQLFNGSADGGSLAVSADLERNLYSLSGSPNGSKEVTLVYLV